ncbi:MAG: DedA family protein [Bacteriovoracaceae bacterium]|nr:DedA family protein [Bacteriovoracaceae bacterium]
MQIVQDYAMANVEIAPFIIGGALLFAGFNLPVPEDLMIFISAILASKNPDYLVPLYCGLFAGAYFSDLIAYALGRFLGPKLFQIKFFANMVTQERLDQVAGYFNKYGMGVLIVGRFIPFGVRNALFISSGLSKSSFPKFAFADFVATIISVSTYFYLYYNFGESMIAIVKKGNVVIFSIFILAILGFWVKKREKKDHEVPQSDDNPQ